MQVLVRDNNIDQALRVLKKKMQREGVFREMKQRKSYEKPSERKNRENYTSSRRMETCPSAGAPKLGSIRPRTFAAARSGNDRACALGSSSSICLSLPVSNV